MASRLSGEAPIKWHKVLGKHVRFCSGAAQAAWYCGMFSPVRTGRLAPLRYKASTMKWSRNPVV